ncbi:MAG: hypothetical protein Q9163_003709 [Psora crenata]
MGVDIRSPLHSHLFVCALIQHFKQIWDVPFVEHLEPHSKTCHICLEPYLSGERPEFPIRLSCGHILGAQCFWNWFAPWTPQHHGSCPICRANIVREWELVPEAILYDGRRAGYRHPHDSLLASSTQGVDFGRTGQPREVARIHQSLESRATVPLWSDAVTVATPAFWFIPHQEPSTRYCLCIGMTSYRYWNISSSQSTGETETLVQGTFIRGNATFRQRSDEHVTSSALNSEMLTSSIPSGGGAVGEAHRPPNDPLAAGLQILASRSPDSISQTPVQHSHQRTFHGIRADLSRSTRIRPIVSETPTQPLQGNELMRNLCEALIRRIEQFNFRKGRRREFWADVAARVLYLVPLWHIKDAILSGDPDILLVANIVPREYEALKIYLESGAVRLDDRCEDWEAQRSAWMRRIEIRD